MTSKRQVVRSVRLRSAALWLAAVVIFSVTGPSPARADLLNPNDFASLGTLSIPSGSPGWDVETSKGAPTLTNGTTTYTGVVQNGVAVFDFNTINIASGSSLSINGQAFPTSANFDSVAYSSLPVALLSRSDINVAGTINVAPIGVAGPGAGRNGHVLGTPNPEASLVGGGGGGGFGTPGEAGGSIAFTNPPVFVSGGAGGSTYGDLTKTLQNGSPGGYSFGPLVVGAFSQNYGGGAIELGANGTINISGKISAVGGSDNGLGINKLPPGFGNGGDGAGGGSGGAILVHANTVNISNLSDLNVSGGLGASGGLFVHDEVYAGGNGGEGRITIVSAASVPEPSSLALSAAATLAGLGLAWRRRVKAKA